MKTATINLKTLLIASLTLGTLAACDNSGQAEQDATVGNNTGVMEEQQNDSIVQGEDTSPYQTGNEPGYEQDGALQGESQYTTDTDDTADIEGNLGTEQPTEIGASNSEDVAQGN